VYMMTHNGNDVIAPTAQAAMPAITFLSLCKAALPSPFFLLVFKSLHLADICTLTSAF